MSPTRSRICFFGIWRGVIQVEHLFYAKVHLLVHIACISPCWRFISLPSISLTAYTPKTSPWQSKKFIGSATLAYPTTRDQRIECVDIVENWEGKSTRKLKIKIQKGEVRNGNESRRRELDKSFLHKMRLRWKWVVHVQKDVTFNAKIKMPNNVNWNILILFEYKVLFAFLILTDITTLKYDQRYISISIFYSI